MKCCSQDNLRWILIAGSEVALIHGREKVNLGVGEILLIGLQFWCSIRKAGHVGHFQL